jgi:HEAT repeats
MGLYSQELDGLNLHELEQQFEREGDYDDFYEEVVQHIAAQGSLGLSYLKNVIEEAQMDVRQLRAAIWILGPQEDPQEEDPWYHEKLQPLLQDSRELVVAAAVEGLAAIKVRSLRENILQLLTHPSPYVRGSVLRYMSKLFPNEAPPLLIKALKDPHYIVRENAIDELDDLDYYQALPDIRPFLHDQHEDVRQAAETAVENLTLVKFEQEGRKHSIPTHSHMVQFPGSAQGTTPTTGDWIS